MTNTVVVGTQWGDEGKGKIVDLVITSYSIHYTKLYDVCIDDTYDCTIVEDVVANKDVLLSNRH